MSGGAWVVTVLLNDDGTIVHCCFVVDVVVVAGVCQWPSTVCQTAPIDEWVCEAGTVYHHHQHHQHQ